MKMSKRMAAGILAAAMAVSVCAVPMTALAYDVTIDDQIETHVEHTYKAYQIFKGILVEDPDSTDDPKEKILTEIGWGNNINSTDLLEDLAADPTFASCTDLESTVAFLQTLQHDSEEMQAFAEIVKANITGEPEKTGTERIEGLEGGYYLIDDVADVSNVEDAISRYVLGVFDDVSVTVKKDIPTITKTIDDDPTDETPGVSANTASLGDKIPYVLTSQVPDMTGYEKYFFVIRDTMSEGLTFNNDIVIKIGNDTLNSEAYTVEFNEENNSFEIAITNFIQYKCEEPDEKKDIIVTYSATLDEDAKIGSEGNPNTVDLIYSNDPNFDYQGTDKPAPNDVTGKTPESTVTTYTAALNVLKVDAKDNNLKLKGAVFQIAGNGVKIVVADNKYFKEDEEGEYYLLTDGTYTDQAPEEDTESKYISTTTKYKLLSEITYNDASEGAIQTAVTGTDGIARFERLNEGVYTITELQAPAGYNKVTTPFEVTISAEPSLEGCTWTFSGVEGETDGDATFTFTVKNNKGITLPGTGGIGTVLFYVVGTLLMTGSAVLLVKNNKKKAEDK